MATVTALTEAQTEQLDQAGYLVLRQVLSPAEVTALLDRLESLWAAEQEQAGAENYIEKDARRLANLYNKGDVFRRAFTDPLVLEAVSHVVGPDIRLSMLNARDVPPHSDPHMPFHADTDQGLKPDEHGYNACTVIWMLDDFTQANGATRLVVGSHRTGLLPKEGLTDIFATHPDEVVVEGRAGDVFIFNGHCWHTGGANQTEAARRAILVHFMRAGYPCRLNPQTDLEPTTIANAAPLERALLGLTD
jgi:ectoine hydroxylase-related dioxygenase (phytanoyl-CoA dioxygenase family)